MEAKITFGNGKSIKAEKNAESFITKQKPSFPAALGLVTIEAAEESRTYQDPEIIECASIDGRYWFCFAEESAQAKELKALREENETLAGAIEELAAILGGEE